MESDDDAANGSDDMEEYGYGGLDQEEDRHMTKTVKATAMRMTDLRPMMMV